MRLLMVTLLTLCVSSISWADAHLGYWEYSEYYRLHPEQNQASKELIEAVRKDPVKIDYNNKETRRQIRLKTKTPNKKIKIAIIYPSLQLSDYWPRSVKSFELRMKDLGINYEIKTEYTRQSVDVSKQMLQIKEVLKWKPDYLVYTLDSARQRKIVERLIIGTDVKLILQNITTPIKKWGKNQPFMYVGFDHTEGAKILAKYQREHIPQGTSYGVVFRSKGLVSQLRGLTYIRDIGNYHQLKSSYYTDSSRDGGYKAAMLMMNDNPEIKYIYACSTDTALGTVDALEELNRLDVIVNGWGGGSEEIKQLKNGKLNVVLMRINDSNGISMAEAIKRDLEGKAVPLIFSGDFTVLDESMTPEEIEKIEETAFRYSNKVI